MKKDFSFITILTILFFLSSSNKVFAQSTWNLGGNATSTEGILGTTSNQNLNLITNNNIKILLKSTDSIILKGTAIFDSIKIPNGFAYIDSIRTRVLHIGDSSITIGANGMSSNTSNSATNNDITCSNGVLNFGKSPSNGTFTDFSMNIGTRTTTYKLHLHDGIGVGNPPSPYIHFTNNATGPQTTSHGFAVGIASNGEADLLQKEAKLLRFLVNGAYRMQIEPSNGYVAIGNSFNNPSQLLDVNGGNININSPSNGYRIGAGIGGSKFVLWHNNIVSNIYVGVDAGNASGNGINNTLVGNQTGRFISSGNANTFLGAQAGSSNTTGFSNTFIGHAAGRNNVRGSDNVLIGDNTGSALLGNILNNIDYNNVFIGNNSGLYMTGGYSNTFLGGGSGNSPSCTGNIHNSTSIGSNSIVLASNTMILGDNNVNVGIGLSSTATGPQNKLEINDNINFGTGLKFRQINALNTPTTNPGSGVLGLDINGNVIYVNEKGLQACGSATPLSNDVEIPLAATTANEHSLYFSGQSSFSTSNTSSVGIGIPCGTATAKLDVENQTLSTATTNFINQYAGKFVNTGSYIIPSGTDEMIGISSECNVVTSPAVQAANLNIGGDFKAINNGRMNIAVRAFADKNSYVNFGVWGNAENAIDQCAGVLGTATNNHPHNIGVHGYANQTNSSSCFGGYFHSRPMATQLPPVDNLLFQIPVGEFGVYGGIDGATSNNGFSAGVFRDSGMPISTQNANNKWAGYFNGSVFSSGGYTNPSDEKLKQEITPLMKQNCLELINKIKPSSYTFKTKDYPMLALPTGTQYGVIAQDLEKSMPFLVKETKVPAYKNDKGEVLSKEVEFKCVNYDGLIPVMIAAIQGLDSTIKTLQKQLSDQNSQINILKECCKLSNTINNQNTETSSNQTINLSDLSIILDQNAPNPFAEQTQINYFIPTEIKDASIIFYNSNGIILKSIELTDRNIKSTLTVFAADLSSGTYTYSLLADGKLVDSKKMICLKK